MQVIMAIYQEEGHDSICATSMSIIYQAFEGAHGGSKVNDFTDNKGNGSIEWMCDDEKVLTIDVVKTEIMDGNTPSVATLKARRDWVFSVYENTFSTPSGEWRAYGKEYSRLIIESLRSTK